MAAKKADLKKKMAIMGIGAAAIAGSIAAAVVLSDEKNRKKVKKLAGELKAKSEDVFAELKTLAQKTTKTDKPTDKKTS